MPEEVNQSDAPCVASARCRAGLSGLPSLHFELHGVEGGLEEMDGAVVGVDDEFAVGPVRIFVSADQKLQRKLFEDVIVGDLEIVIGKDYSGTGYAGTFHQQFSFPRAGNLKAVPTGGAAVRTANYDAENRMTSATVGATTTNYAYDGDGRRVRKTVGAVVTTFVYDPFGRLAQEYGAATDTNTNTKYRHTDKLGSTRLLTKGDGSVDKCYDYLPFGEELGNGTGGRTNACFGGAEVLSVKFTSKERDAETGLDYFGARYMSSAQGRFTSPDKPFADQHLNDPQSWNLYSYVRNNPLAQIDSDGRACTALNNSSGYCQRGELYASFDALVYKQTRFFAAASASTQQLADVAMPLGLGTAGTSEGTRQFLASTNAALEGENIHMVGEIMSGQVSGSGPALDAKLVHREQNAVQRELEGFQKKDKVGYGAAISEINGLLNGKSTVGAGALGFLGRSFSSDGPHAQILSGVRKNLGRDINFANQNDREAIGLGLVKHIRETKGCEVTDNKAHGCGQ